MMLFFQYFVAPEFGWWFMVIEYLFNSSVTKYAIY